MLLISTTNRLWSQLTAWSELAKQRRELAELSDHMLKDIGLSRADAEREASRPFWDSGPNRDVSLRERSQAGASNGINKKKLNCCRQG